MTPTMTQQDFLRLAMAELGDLQELGRPLTREEMCERLGCPAATFRKWMLPSDNGREMPSTLWNHIREILEYERLKRSIAAKKSTRG